MGERRPGARAGRALLAGVLVGLAGCSDPLPLSERAPVPPFDALAGVHLGMRADALAEALPEAEVASYMGYRLERDGRVLLFDVPGASTEGRAPPGRARLAAVETVTEHDDPGRAARAWAEARAEVAGRLGPPTLCLTSDEPHLRSRVRGWPLGRDAWLTLSELTEPSGTVRVQLRAGELHPYVERLREEGEGVCGPEAEAAAAMGSRRFDRGVAVEDPAATSANDGPGRLVPVASGDAEGKAYGSAVGDLDEDGLLDVAMARGGRSPASAPGSRPGLIALGPPVGA